MESKENGEPAIREELPIQHPASTTIGTIVVQGGPLQLVIAVLQCGDLLHIKVADIIPKLTFLGDNLDEALLLQRQHEDLIRQIQEMPSPIAEFYHKVQEKIASNTKIDPNLVLDMAKNLEYIWQDIIRILQLRRIIINYNTNFFEKLGECYGKMSALEVACNDTMIPMETEAVRDFIEKFKLLRTEMLSSVMATLTIGNQLLDQLRDVANQGTLDSRPDFIKQDAINSVRKVEKWLEDLHDKRNSLELAWQTRKTQLEQCLELTMINRDLSEIENNLHQRRQDTLGAFTLGSSSQEASNLLGDLRGWKQDAAALRDKTLKLTKATEQLVSQNFFAGEEACKRAYAVLSQVTEYFDELDRRETLLEQSKTFFERAEVALERLAKQETDIQKLPLRPGSPNVIPTHIRMLDEVKELVVDALTAGYQILDETGRNQPEVFGIEKTIEAIENRNAHLENLCQLNSEKYIKISETLNSFLERYNELFAWLEQQKTEKIIGGPINNMGTNLPEARDCFTSHTHFLADLEEKGNEINSLLGNLKTIVEFLDDKQRHEVDRKIEALRKNWSELKNFVLERVDVIDSYVKFHEQAEELGAAFRKLESDIRDFRGTETGPVQSEWAKVKNGLSELKNAGHLFINQASKVADPYLQTEAAASCVEKILSEFSNRQLELTAEWENVALKNEIETLLKEIIMANEETLSATSKIEAQLYPIFLTDSVLPSEIISYLDERIRSVETDIQFADDELTLRIQKLAKLESRDPETTNKIDQVRGNLDSIKGKLYKIRVDYRNLVKDSRTFLESVGVTRENIRRFFAEKTPVEEIGIDLYSQEYEKFKYKTMEEVHVLLQKSEELISKFKQQEPQGAKEHDTDRIITVLEQLRSFFDQQADQENAKVRKLQVLEEFKRAANDISDKLDDLNGQLEKLDGKYGDSSASAKAISISFEYFERNIELLGKSLENLKNTSKNIIGTYPDFEGFVTGRASEIKQKWDELKEKAKKARKLIDLSIEYFNLIDQIETGYRRHSTYLTNMTALANQINTPESGEHLARELEKYITEHEQPQLNDLKNLAQMSQNIYEEDRTVPIHTDNINLFQSFHKLKADIDERVDKLKEIEAAKMAEERRLLEEKMRQAELEREYANLVDAVDAAYRRHNTYLGNTAALADQINSPESGEHLGQEVAKYIADNETPQMADIRKLAEMSQKIYGEDRTPKIQLENLTLFQALNNLREDIDDKIKNLQAIEAERMEEEKRALEAKLRQAELEREYQNLLDQIEAAYRRHTAYFTNTSALIEQVNTPESGEHLIREIEKYLGENEQPQMTDLNRLSQMSLGTFNEDRSVPVYNDNVTLFQSLHHLRSEVESKVEQLRELEAQKAQREREELEEKMRRAELERAYQDLLDQIEAGCRRHNAYFSNASTLSENINAPEAGEHLARELEGYLRQYEQPQLDKLKALAQMSQEIYGEDLTEGIYLDNVGIFQALRKLLSDVCERIDFLREEEAKQMDEARRALEEQMRKAELEREFTNLVDKIEGARQRHQAYLNNVKSLIPQIRNPESGEHLAKELQKYLEANEQPQIEDLKRLVEIAQRVYGDDRAGPVHTNNIELFQEFHNVKLEIQQKVQELRDADAQRLEEERKALEARMLEAGAERAKIDDQRRREEEQRLALEEARKKEQAELALLEEQRRREELERLSLEEQKLKEQAQLALLEQQRLKELAERDRYEEERKRKDLEHVAAEEQRRKEEAARFASYEPPTFVAPLADTTVTEGGKFQFECVVKSFPEPNIQWYKDGVAIPKDSDYKTSFENGVCRLSIEETFTADTGVFTCKASNSVGASESAAKLFVRETSPLEVFTPPIFVRPLESATAREGAPFAFKAVVSGNPPPQISWFKNDVCVDTCPDYRIKYHNGEASLKFDEVFLEDQALFRCRASNASGFEDSIAQLTVEPLEPTEPPSFKVPLSNIMARVGQKIKLECEIVGIPEPEIFWLHNEAPITREVKLHYDDERAFLVINEAFLKDAGVYTITAKNIAGEVSSSCNVVVKGRLPNEASDSEGTALDMDPIKPSVQLPLKNVAVFEGKPVRLDCVIIGNPEPEVIWYHNEKPVKESQDVQLLFQGDRCSLVINEAFLEDAGDYKVFAINSAGEAFSQCTLSVTPLNLAEPAVRPQPAAEKAPTGKPPKFEKLLTDVLCNEGDFVELECLIQGEPVPEIKWYLNNKPVAEGESSRVHCLHQSDGTVKLKIEDVRVEDKGVYTVKAANEAGEAKCFAHLNVKPIVNAAETQTDVVQPEPQLVEPSFRELFADLTVPESGVAKFECIVIGKPTPKVKWLFNDMPVAGREFLVSTSGDRQVLTIPETTKATTGKISCVAENEVGRAICIAYLNVGTPAGPQIIDNSTHHTHHTSSVHKEYITTNTTKVIENGKTAQDETHTKQLTHDQTTRQTDGGEPQTIESRHFQESREAAVPQVPAIKDAKDVQDSIIATSGQISTGKPARKNLPPRFVTPFVGKIVDQYADVVFEATVDGFPSPIIEVTKNGNPLDAALEHVKISQEKNKVTVELKNVSINDAGRYSCTAANAAGSAGCAADLVVKKSIFPPVFCPRLASTIVNIGDRLNLECSISGAPEPTVTWYKDDKPLKEAGLSTHVLQAFLPNSYKLTIEHAQSTDAGKYMVKATNAGGEARSIADVVVMEKQQTFVQLPQVQIQPNQVAENAVVSQTQTVTKQFVSSSTMAAGPEGISFGTNTEITPLATGATQTRPPAGQPIATQTAAEPISTQTATEISIQTDAGPVGATSATQTIQNLSQTSTQTATQSVSSMSTQTLQEVIKVQRQTLEPDTPSLTQVTQQYIVLPPLNESILSATKPEEQQLKSQEPPKLQQLSLDATQAISQTAVKHVTAPERVVSQVQDLSVSETPSESLLAQPQTPHVTQSEHPETLSSEVLSLSAPDKPELQDVQSSQNASLLELAQAEAQSIPDEGQHIRTEEVQNEVLKGSIAEVLESEAVEAQQAQVPGAIETQQPSVGEVLESQEVQVISSEAPESQVPQDTETQKPSVGEVLESQEVQVISSEAPESQVPQDTETQKPSTGEVLESQQIQLLSPETSDSQVPQEIIHENQEHKAFIVEKSDSEIVQFANPENSHSQKVDLDAPKQGQSLEKQSLENVPSQEPQAEQPEISQNQLPDQAEEGVLSSLELKSPETLQSSEKSDAQEPQNADITQAALGNEISIQTDPVLGDSISTQTKSSKSAEISTQSHVDSDAIGTQTDSLSKEKLKNEPVSEAQLLQENVNAQKSQTAQVSEAATGNEISIQTEPGTAEGISTQTNVSSSEGSTQTSVESTGISTQTDKPPKKLAAEPVQVADSEQVLLQQAQPHQNASSQFSTQTEARFGESISTQTSAKSSEISTQSEFERSAMSTQTDPHEPRRNQETGELISAQTEMETLHPVSQSPAKKSITPERFLSQTSLLIQDTQTPLAHDLVQQTLQGHVTQTQHSDSPESSDPDSLANEIPPNHQEPQLILQAPAQIFHTSQPDSPKPVPPSTPTKGLRLQDRIKSLEEAQREKGDVLVPGGIKVLPQMSVEEKRTESHFSKSEFKSQQVTQKPAQFVPEPPIEPQFTLEQYGQFTPQQYADFNEPPKPYEGVPYMPEPRPFEINTENVRSFEQKTFEYKPFAPLPEVQPIQPAPLRQEVQTPASGYQGSITESEEELRLSTMEKRRLFEQKIQEVASSGPVDRPGYVQLYNPEELDEEQQAHYKTLQAKKEMFEQKIQELQESNLPPLAHRADLSAPIQPRQPRPLSALDVGLEPGAPPEILFAPKYELHQESVAHQVQQINQSAPPQPPPKPVHHPVAQQPAPVYHQPAPQTPAFQQPAPVYHQPAPQTPAFQQQAPVYHQQAPIQHSDFHEEYNSQSGPNFSQTESRQEFSSFSQTGFRRVEAPKSLSQTAPLVIPKPVAAPSHFERPAEPEPSFKPIPTVPAPVQAPRPVAPQRPAAGSEEFSRRSYSEQQQHSHKSTHQKIVQHHHTESRTYQQQQQHYHQPLPAPQPQPPQPQPKLVKPIPINASSSSKQHQKQTYQSSQSIQQEFQPLEPFPFKPDAPRAKPARVPPPPSPSKFIKGEFRESEYESYDSRIGVKWHPQNQGEENLHYKPVRPVFTPTNHGGRSTLGHTPTPPTEFDRPPTLDGPPRPKFQPIERQQEPVAVPHTQVVRPKPVQAKPVYSQSRSHDERVHREIYASEPQTKTYYTAIAGAPVHNAIATETSKSMHMKEHTEKTQRTVNVTHTHRVISLEDTRRQQNEKLEPFPYTPPPVSMRTRQRVPPPPTPTKFIPGEFRESDYDSEVDSARIRPLWTPNPEDQDDPRYRPVRPPSAGGRATSVPRSYERVMTPMEFDHGPIMPSKIDVLSDRDYYNRTQTLDRSLVRKEKQSKTTRDDIDIRNKYTSYKSVAQQQIDSMSSQFKDKAHQFIRDISHEQHQQQQQPHKPILKRASSVQSDRKPQFYRDENRVSEYGTKHIDPDTGLIYFKYDFGYEFGIIFPGEGRKVVGGYRNNQAVGGGTATPRNEISNKPSTRQAGDIEVPVLHERTPSAAKSEAAKKRYSLPVQFNGSEPADAWNSSYGRATPSTPVVLGNVVNQEAPQAPRKPPLWITPLRDIAAVSGQAARFECIVQCDPHPDIVWAKNGALLSSDSRVVIEFRNGVCRLTIPQVFPGDAGEYCCVATNCIGSTTTTAQLIVPSGAKGVRK